MQYWSGNGVEEEEDREDREEKGGGDDDVGVCVAGFGAYFLYLRLSRSRLCRLVTFLTGLVCVCVRDWEWVWGRGWWCGCGFARMYQDVAKMS